MLRDRTFILILAVIAALTLPSPASAGDTKTVVVDCANGESIAQALAKAAEILIVEITGICDEEIVIERDEVTLRGVDPLSDGIRGLAGGGNVVAIRHARDVRIENLGILDGARDGVAILSSDGVFIVNSRIVGHARNGVGSNGGQFVRCTDLEIDAANFGWSALGDSICSGCTINGGSFGWINFGGQQSIIDSTVTGGTYGVWSQTGGALNVRNSSVSGGFGAGVAIENASLDFSGSTFDGALFCSDQCSLVLNNSQQTSGPGFNAFDNQAHVLVGNGSELLGFQLLDYFSTLAIDDGLAGTSLVNGDLVCSSGSDAWCPDAATNVTGASCGQCV